MTSVAAVVSQKTNARQRRKKLCYTESVTPTDEAFALMALKYHKDKWMKVAAVETQEGEKEKKKRVSGLGKSAS